MYRGDVWVKQCKIDFDRVDLGVGIVEQIMSALIVAILFAISIYTITSFMVCS